MGTAGNLAVATSRRRQDASGADQDRVRPGVRSARDVPVPRLSGYKASAPLRIRALRAGRSPPAESRALPARQERVGACFTRASVSVIPCGAVEVALRRAAVSRSRKSRRGPGASGARCFGLCPQPGEMTPPPAQAPGPMSVGGANGKEHEQHGGQAQENDSHHDSLSRGGVATRDNMALLRSRRD